MTAKEYLIEYLEKETDFYNKEKVDGYGIMKADNFVKVLEQYANQRVIEELEIILETVSLDNNPYIIRGVISEVIKELKQ